MTEDRRRLKQLLIDPNVLLRLFAGNGEPVRVSCAGLPHDATLAGAGYDIERNAMRVYVHSATFPVVEDNLYPPYLIVEFTRYTEDERTLRVVPTETVGYAAR